MSIFAKAWYWIVDTLYQLKIRFMGLRELPEFMRRPVENKDALVIVMVQGIGSKVVAGRPLAKFIVDAGYPLITVPELGYNTNTVPDSARIVANQVRSLGLTRVILACGSKGALVGKYVLAHHNEDGAFKGMVAIAGAFSGSPLAHLVPFPAFKELVPGNPVLQELLANTAVNGRIVSIYARYDNYLVAPHSGRLIGALDNVEVPYSGHNIMGFKRRTWEEVMKGIRKIEALDAAP